MDSAPLFIIAAISDALCCRGSDLAGAKTPLSIHSSARLLRSATVLSASRSSRVRSMAPAKPRGGVMTARSSSAADSCHVFGPSCVPADNADPAASPLITTAAFGPGSLAETVKLAASSVRSGRTAPTVSDRPFGCRSLLIELAGRECMRRRAGWRRRTQSVGNKTDSRHYGEACKSACQHIFPAGRRRRRLRNPVGGGSELAAELGNGNIISESWALV